MSIKIGHHAVGEKFLSSDRAHEYIVLKYIPPGVSYKFKGTATEGAYPRGRYVVASRYNPSREGFLYPSNYIPGRKAWLARQKLPV